MKKLILLFILGVKLCYAHITPCDSIVQIRKANFKNSSNPVSQPSPEQNNINIRIDNSQKRIPSQNIEKTHDCINSKRVNTYEPSNLKRAIKFFLDMIPALIVASIAGFIALYQVKSNIISSSRIKWIEDLRQTFSEYATSALDVVFYHNNHILLKNSLKEDINNKEVAEKEREYYNSYLVTMSKFNTLSYKVKMLLNSDEAEHKQLENIVNKIDKLLDKDIVTSTQATIETELNDSILLAKRIFKKEWEKSKRFRI